MSQNTSLEFSVYPRQLNALTNNQLRKQNLIPAIVYGNKQKNITLSVDINSVLKYIKREYENKIFTFKSEDKSLNGLKVLKKDISYHKLSKKPLHIDFLSLDMSKSVRVNIEINFEGKAKGVKEDGGVFNVMRRTVEIECLPTEIPNAFSIDISSLSINQNFHVSDISIPKGTNLITSLKESLCAVTEPKQEEETTTKPSVDNTETTTSTNNASKEADSKSATTEKVKK